jgi:hypothetical protein
MFKLRRLSLRHRQSSEQRHKAIFVVTSEWDTQIGKQLRGMTGDMLSSRIFLERCNRENIKSRESITGCGRKGEQLLPEFAHPEKRLREAGRQWSDNILENVRAPIMTFVYIVATVTAGYPLVTGLSIACGLNSGNVFYASKSPNDRQPDSLNRRILWLIINLLVARFLDSLLYFFLPQINITILREVQGLNLRHRMVGRIRDATSVVWTYFHGDAPPKSSMTTYI